MFDSSYNHMLISIIVSGTVPAVVHENRTSVDYDTYTSYQVQNHINIEVK